MSGRRLGTTEQGQLKNIKDEDQKVPERDVEDKDPCRKFSKYVREGVKCGVCDRWIHYKCEEITQQQVQEEYSDKISQLSRTDRKKIEEKIKKQWKEKFEKLIHKKNSAHQKLKRMKKKVKEMEKNYSELKDIPQRTKKLYGNIKKDLQKMKQKTETSKTLRKLNKIKIQAGPAK